MNSLSHITCSYLIRRQFKIYLHRKTSLNKCLYRNPSITGVKNKEWPPTWHMKKVQTPQTLGTVILLRTWASLHRCPHMEKKPEWYKWAGKLSSAQLFWISLCQLSVLSAFCRRTLLRQALLNKGNHYSASPTSDTWIRTTLWAFLCLSWLSDVQCRY